MTFTISKKNVDQTSNQIETKPFAAAVSANGAVYLSVLMPPIPLAAGSRSQKNSDKVG